ncbi:MAG TPA: XdhC family protein [Longimicrobiales bacterium]|nr:XdhC family protein [Longimicrobiales bacterium]
MSDVIAAASAASAALAAELGGPAVCVLLRVDGEQAGRRRLVWEDGRAAGSLGEAALDDAAGALAQEAFATGRPALRTLDGRDIFVEVHRAADPLIVVGAGHIAVPLAALGVQLGFQVTVLDDRDEFARAERFAEGVDVQHADFEADPFADVAIDDRTSVALVTRGHRWDFDCLERLLRSDVQPRYIGMIGSRRRTRAALSALLAAGVPRARLAAVRAPIGLDVGAETPVEIAVAIAAELVQARRGGTGEPLTLRERVLERLLPEPVEHEAH